MKREHLFKVLNADMSNPVASKKMRYELGKWYHEDECEMCVKGLHLTRDPSKWKDREDQIICIAEAKNIVAWQGDKCVCKDIRLIAIVGQPALAEYEKVRQQALADLWKRAFDEAKA